jgi:hypothetical protein
MYQTGGLHSGPNQDVYRAGREVGRLPPRAENRLSDCVKVGNGQRRTATYGSTEALKNLLLAKS